MKKSLALLVLVFTLALPAVTYAQSNLDPFGGAGPDVGFGNNPGNDRTGGTGTVGAGPTSRTGQGNLGGLGDDPGPDAFAEVRVFTNDGGDAGFGLVPCSGPDCNTCSVIQLVNNVISFLVTILSVLAVIVLVFAGFKMVTSGGNQTAWEDGKSMFGNVIIGIIIVLAAWLIVDTLLGMLTRQGGLEFWGTVSCSAPISAAGTTERTANNRFFPTSNTGVSGEQYSDSAARTVLAQNGIGVNKTEAEGTSLAGINQSTVQEVIGFRESCNCAVTVTGGTESTGGHASGRYSHGTGYKFDMRHSTSVDNFIMNNFNSSGRRSDGAALYTNPDTGAVYARESTHWDVLVR